MGDGQPSDAEVIQRCRRGEVEPFSLLVERYQDRLLGDIEVITALEIVLWVLAPAPLIAACRAIERGRGRCLLLGLSAAAVTLALLSVLGQHPAAARFVAPVLLGIVALGSLTGLTAVTALLGQGAIDLAGRSGSRALAIGVGSLLFGFVVLFPMVGQVLGTYFVLVGLGGAITALTHSRQPKK